MVPQSLADKAIPICLNYFDWLVIIALSNDICRNNIIVSTRNISDVDQVFAMFTVCDITYRR